MRIENETAPGEHYLGEGPIEPKGQLAEEEGISAYVDVCEDMWKHTMVIEDVYFADGSKWELKQPGKSER